MISVCIVTNDILYGRMLQLEISDICRATLHMPREIKDATADLYFFDADCSEQFETLPSGAYAVFGRKQNDDHKFKDAVFFLKRPFDMSELKSNILRFSGTDENHDSIVLELRNGTVYIYGQPVVLSPTEFAVFNVLYENRGIAVSRRQINEATKKNEKNAAASNSADVYISFLRKKLESPYGIRLIRSVRGIGYMLI